MQIVLVLCADVLKYPPVRFLSPPPNTMEVTGILLVVFKALKNYNWKTWEERLFLERMSRLLWIIHRPHCGTVFIGTSFYWRKGPSEICGLARVTRTLFSGKSCCCWFFQLWFFFSVLWTTKMKLYLPFSGVMVADVKENKISAPKTDVGGVRLRQESWSTRSFFFKTTCLIQNTHYITHSFLLIQWCVEILMNE